jgi:hypothetical protein
MRDGGVRLRSWIRLGVPAACACVALGSAAAAFGSGSAAPRLRVFAAAVNLRGSSVPGFKPVLGGGEEPAHPGPVAGEVEACDGGPVMPSTSRGVASPLLQKERVPIETIVSAVYSMGSATRADGYLTAADSERGIACVEKAEEKQYAPLHAPETVEAVSLEAPSSLAGVSGVRVWKCLTSAAPCASSSVRSFEDRLWFATGRYVVTLYFIAGARNEAKGAGAVALPVEQRIVALLKRRAAAGSRRAA